MDIYVFWFIVLAILMTGYAVLDGFDFGVGIIHLLSNTEEQKQANLSAIGPFWDGNEVWLVTLGGALFAAFPEVYATLFSGFYLALMLVLLALIGRAVSIELRNKIDSQRWKRTCDLIFGVSSLVAALLLGIAVGALIAGVPIGQDGEFHGTFFDILTPYSTLVGVITVILFAVHGHLYLILKTTGEYQSILFERAKRLNVVLGVILVVGYMVTLTYFTRLHAVLNSNFIAWAALTLNIIAYVSFSFSLAKQAYGKAFIASAGIIASLIFVIFSLAFPNLLYSTLNPEWSLTVTNAASSVKTLKIMQIIALCGMPLVIGYSIFIYRSFKGSVKY